MSHPSNLEDRPPGPRTARGVEEPRADNCRSQSEPATGGRRDIWPVDIFGTHGRLQKDFISIDK